MATSLDPYSSSYIHEGNRRRISSVTVKLNNHVDCEHLFLQVIKFLKDNESLSTDIYNSCVAMTSLSISKHYDCEP